MTQWMKALSLSKPVIQAPMAGGLVTPRLAAAVSNEGALGSLASGYLSPATLEKQIIEMQELTGSAFQVNVFVPEKGRHRTIKRFTHGNRTFRLRNRRLLFL